jgi:hypothetical protein
MVHSNLSAAYLQAGNKEAALQHAQEAVALAPAGFHMVSCSCMRWPIMPGTMCMLACRHVSAGLQGNDGDDLSACNRLT